MVLENETLDLARDKKELFNIFIKSLVETQMQQDPMASSAPCATIVSYQPFTEFNTEEEDQLDVNIELHVLRKGKC